MDADGTNPYVAPGTPRAPDEIGASDLSPRNAYRKIALYAVVVSVAWSSFVGLVETFRLSFGLARFGGLQFIPRVLVLEGVRVKASGIAFQLTWLTAVTVAHRASRASVASFSSTRGRREGLWVLAPAMLVIFPVATICFIGAGCLLLGGVYAQPWSPMLASMSESLRASDVVAGTLFTAALALALQLLLPHALCFVARSRQALAAKLIVGAVVGAIVIGALEAVMSALAGAVAP